MQTSFDRIITSLDN